MNKPPWRFVADDDDQVELWENEESGETERVERDGPPLYEVPGDEVDDEPLYGPPD